MRLEIVFKTANSFIPINYQYMLCSFVYKRLKYTDENFASFLHEEGFNGFRMFTFSQLFFENSHVKNGSIIISEGKGKWYISSLSEDFIRNFFSSIIENPFIELEGVLFNILQVRVLDEPKITDQMKFILISPLVVSIPVENQGKLSHKYLTPEDDFFQNAINVNLIKKYSAFFGKEISSKVYIQPDWNYIQRKGRITKLIQIKNTFVRGTVFPFLIKGDPGLIKVGYEAGFGEKNSLGFGMVKVCKNDNNLNL